MFLPVTETGRIPVDTEGRPVLVAEPAGDILVEIGEVRAFVLETSAAEKLGALRDATFLLVSTLCLKRCILSVTVAKRASIRAQVRSWTTQHLEPWGA